MPPFRDVSEVIREIENDRQHLALAIDPSHLIGHGANGTSRQDSYVIESHSVSNPDSAPHGNSGSYFEPHDIHFEVNDPALIDQLEAITGNRQTAAQAAAVVMRHVTEVVFADENVLAGPTEAAAILGVSTQRISQMMNEGQMPKPLGKLKRSTVWFRSDVEKILKMRQLAAELPRPRKR